MLDLPTQEGVYLQTPEGEYYYKCSCELFAVSQESWLLRVESIIETYTANILVISPQWKYLLETVSIYRIILEPKEGLSTYGYCKAIMVQINDRLE